MIKNKKNNLFILLIVIVSVIQIFNLDFVWHTLPLENHAWRNTQTLISVVSILKGFSPFNLQIMGSTEIPMEFPLYQYIVYFLYSIASGWSDKVDLILLTDIGRIVSLTSVIGIFTYPLAVKFKNNTFLAVFLSILFASLVIEYEYMSSVVTAPLGDAVTALIYVVSIHFFRNIFSKEINMRDLIIGTIFLTIAALSKVTTVFIFIIALPLFYSIQKLPDVIIGLKANQSMEAIAKSFGIYKLVLISIPLFVAYIFVVWGDSVKEANYFSAMLTSQELRGWNMGYIDTSIIGRISTLYNSQLVWIRPFIGVVFVSLVLCAVLFKKYRAYYFLMIVSAAATLILFQNLFSHNYYILAIFPYLSVSLADLSYYAYKRWSYKKLTNPTTLSILGVATVFLLIMYETVNSHAGKTSKEVFLQEQKNHLYQIELSKYIKEHLDEDQIFAANGFGYSTILPFLSGRQSFMINDLTTIGYKRRHHKEGAFNDLLQAASIKDPVYYVTCGKDKLMDSVRGSFTLKEVLHINGKVECSIFKMQRKK